MIIHFSLYMHTNFTECICRCLYKLYRWIDKTYNESYRATTQQLPCIGFQEGYSHYRAHVITPNDRQAARTATLTSRGRYVRRNERPWQCSQVVELSGSHHWHIWNLTQANTAWRCASTSSFRFHAVGCWAKIEMYVSLDFVWKWREADDEFIMTRCII